MNKANSVEDTYFSVMDTLGWTVMKQIVYKAAAALCTDTEFEVQL
jgi:hypothetical protein